MAIDYDALTSRGDALVSLLEAAAATLARGLPEAPGVYLGMARETLDGTHFCIFIARNGLPQIEYDMGTQTASVVADYHVALQTYWPESTELLETYCGYLCANVLSVLLANAQRSGDDGWRRAIVQGSDAMRFRREGQESAYEIEVIPVRVTFEVTTDGA